MENLNLIIASNLTFLRKKAGLTQLEFGEKFNYTDKTVSRWENGTIVPAVETLKDIADFYGVSVDYLLSEHNSAADFKMTIKDTINPSRKMILISLAVTVIWLIAMTIYVASLYRLGTGKPSENRYWTVFLWAVPVSFITMAFLTKRYFKGSIWSYIFLSAFVWTILLAAFFAFLYMDVYWYLFFIGIPLQIAIILLMKLRAA